MLDIDQLRTFVAIADSGSFTKAADAVFKTQSAVSMQMKRLEERVGQPLFERDGRASRLTANGERLLEFARRILKLNNDAMSAFSSVELHGRVRLGLPDDYAERYLPEILASFSRSNPRAEVTVVCEQSGSLAGRIREGELDIAIITHYNPGDPAEDFRTEELLWVTSARGTAHHDNPLPLALGVPSCSWRRSALDALERVGRPHRILYSSGNASAVVAATLAGLAVSVMPESGLRPGLRVLTANEGFPPLPPITIGLLRNWSERTEVSDALADHIVGALSNVQEAAQ